jgi:ubiquitin C
MSLSPRRKKDGISVRRNSALEELSQGQLRVLVYDLTSGGKLKNVPEKHQGVWQGYTASVSPTEIWIFPPGQSPLKEGSKHIHGTWGYKPGVLLKERKKHTGINTDTDSFLQPSIKPDDLWFFAPHVKEFPKFFTPQGVWTFPMVKTDISQIAPETAGFLKVGDSVKTHKLDVAGTWKMLYRRPGEPVVDDDGGQVKGPGMRSRGTKSAPTSPVKKMPPPVKKIKVHVRAPDGTIYTLSGLQPTDTIGKVKEHLELPVDIPKSKQKLAFQGTPLTDDDTTLKDAGIKSGNTIDLEQMTIFINKDDGKKIPVAVDPDMTIKKLKQTLKNYHDIYPEDYKTLQYQGQTLDDPKTTLNDYGIPDKAVVDLIEKDPWRITVQTPSGKHIPLTVDPTDSFLSVKQQVKDQTAIPIKEQRHFFEGDMLQDDGKKLEDLGIHDGATLQLEGMLVNVQDADGDVFELDVEATTTIKDIKQKLFDEHGLLPAQQRLSYDDSMLDDDKCTLRDYQIHHKATLHLEPMQITIYNVRDKTTIELAADPGDTIADVKDMVYVAEGIPNNEQRLTFKNKVLGDATSLKENRIGHATTLRLEGMQIYVDNTELKKKYLLDVEFTTTIEQVKEKLEAQEKIKMGDQRLFFDEVELDDYKTLRELEIQHKETIVVAPMQINVKTPSGKILSFIVKPTDKVRQVMKMITDEEGIPKHEQRLFFGSQELDDAYKLAHFHIVHGSTLDMAGMQIFVQDVDGETFSLDVDPSTTIEVVKEMIEDTTGIASDDQRLFFKDEKLQDNKTLRDYRVRHNSTLELHAMELNVRTPDGNVLTLSVDPYDTVAAVKKKIEEKAGIPADSQRLLFVGNELEDAPTLSAYGIQHGTTLDLGGMEIDIKDWTGKRFTLFVEPNETLSIVRSKIEEAEGVPVAEQYLLFQKNLLDDDGRSLADYNLKHKSTLHLDRMKIVVETPRGKFLMDVDPTTTVDEIKKQVNEKVGIPQDQHTIGFDGEELDGPTTISDAGIEYRDSVEVGVKVQPKQEAPSTPPDSPERPTYTVQVGPWQSPFDYKPKPKIKRPMNGVRAKKHYNQLSDFYANAVNTDTDVNKWTSDKEDD